MQYSYQQNIQQHTYYQLTSDMQVLEDTLILIVPSGFKTNITS